MDTKLLKAAASFALQYKRVHGEALLVTSLVTGLGAQEKINKACLQGLEDPMLNKATKDFALALGLVLSVAPELVAEPKPVPVTLMKTVIHVSDVPEKKATAKQWEMILSCAYEVAGPMAEVWIEQARASGPNTLKAAILASKQSMGAFGNDFAKALRHHLIEKS